jgi:hypothetical protein
MRRNFPAGRGRRDNRRSSRAINDLVLATHGRGIWIIDD